MLRGLPTLLWPAGELELPHWEGGLVLHIQHNIIIPMGIIYTVWQHMASHYMHTHRQTHTTHTSTHTHTHTHTHSTLHTLQDRQWYVTALHRGEPSPYIYRHEIWHYITWLHLTHARVLTWHKMQVKKHDHSILCDCKLTAIQNVYTLHLPNHSQFPCTLNACKSRWKADSYISPHHSCHVHPP